MSPPIFYPVPRPAILSTACSHFAVHFDPAALDPIQSADQLQIPLPRELRRAARQRQTEFLAGRFAARAALAGAGWPEPAEIGMSGDQSPSWPFGIVGSITHTRSYAAAAVANSHSVRAIGIDSEVKFDRATAREIRSLITSASEIERLSAELSEELSLSLIFSAKESLYKALAPLVGRFFDFTDAEVLAIYPSTRELRLTLGVDLNEEFKAGMEITVRYAISDLVHTAVELPAIIA